MFTGLIEEVGQVTAVSGSANGAEITIASRLVLDDLAIGDSIAVNGVCLTVISYGQDSFTAQAVAETLYKSNLAHLQYGQRVNLERALLPTTRLGGHIVQGHVDCNGRILERIQRELGQELVIELPLQFTRFAAPTGSITVDGVSLTIATSHSNQVRVAVIPHTAAQTTLGELQIGATVNLEMDVLAKYTARLLETDGNTKTGNSADS
ncbi:MAG: riboflavin synthase [Candidatus Delongbacteria bacterium]|nr:riboflavin synthase [Candidatus Delongbacteria bacterium]